MAIQVYIPTPFRQYTGGSQYVEVAADTVGDLLQRLVEQHPQLKERVFAADGSIAMHLNVYVNQDEIRSLQGAETPLKPGDEVALIPAMAGGQMTAKPLLNEEQMERYSRHIRLREVGVAGQAKLLQSKVLIVGAGGLGSPSSIYLAAAGVGTIGIIDADRVDLSNLQRQVLHFNHDVGRPKTQSARRHLEDLNPDVRVIEHNTLLTSENALDIIKPYDVVINGSDNFPTRYLVNDACVMLGKPLVDASILRFEGQATVFMPGKGCYRCLFPSPPPPGMVPSCADAGIIGALAGHLGTWQAMEAVKILLGIGEPMTNRLLIYDALAGEYRTLRWQRNPQCPVCGDEPSITTLIDYEAFCGMPLPEASDTAQDDRAGAAALASLAVAGSQEQDTAGEPSPGLTLEQLMAWDGEDLQPPAVADLVATGSIQVVDVREPDEFAALRIPQAKLISLGELSQRLDELDSSRPALFVCRSGQRSSMAVQALRRAGYNLTYNLAGGMLAWENFQFPTVSDLPGQPS